MDATTTVAVAGLAATTTLGLIGPFLQGRIAARNARHSKNHDLAIAAYTDAMAYIQHAETDLVRIFDLGARAADDLPPDRRDLDLITARLRLTAPNEVLGAWAVFVEAEDLLRSALREKHATQLGDRFEQPADMPEFTAVWRAAETSRLALRRAAGTR
ncbi:hypothetical protein ACPPVO_22400 [Dactylosporangium sp. McL0621]|uniref:hypothetical protein n=1 Tax=Dactylosporangium sp. McL0621 TaxID=3415678 RepID=UPI003CF544AF